MKRILVGSTILLIGVAAVVAQTRTPEQAMASAARALLATLDDAQRAKIRFAFDSDERLNWHFIPRVRQGLPLKAMTEPQRAAAFTLLKTGLSQQGFTKAETIRNLENVLRDLERSNTRDPEQYFFTIFGEPGQSPWAWRYEGHHSAQNWTVVAGKAIATTPAFFGANPAVVQDGPLKGTRALSPEADLAWALLRALTPEQMAAAVTSPTAPNDILTTNSKKAPRLEDVGLVASTLTSRQQGLLMTLIEAHAGNQASGLAEKRLAVVRADGLANIRFAWLGSTEEGKGHYYRIQGKSFLIEYDNTQNNANHQHVVWRDFAGDFGADVLAEHYAQDPDHAGQRAPLAALPRSVR
jgi:uncharacterized protein DUF3500